VTTRSPADYRDADAPRAHGPRVALLAPPGAGKSTQGARLAELFGIEHISVGDVLREHMDRETKVGRRAAEDVERGELVPDDVVMEAVLPRLAKAAAAGGFVLDGFPRSVAQATAAADAAERLGTGLDAVIYLQVPEEELMSRLLRRGEEEDRVDDTPEVIENRLRTFAEETEPLVSYYRDKGLLVTVNGDQPTDEVTAEILDRLAQLGVAPRQRG
jgi:adenylate kinase